MHVLVDYEKYLKRPPFARAWVVAGAAVGATAGSG